jgi:hypothetical protein
MVNVVSKRCVVAGCNGYGNYGLPGDKRTHCGQHASDDMVCMTYKMCNTCSSTCATNPIYEGMCARCFHQTYPDNPITRHFKIKERHVTDAIREGLGDLIEERNIRCTLDRRVQGGCSAKRPDIVLDAGTHFVYVECDEFDHKTYTCEERREMILLQDAGLPVIIIRFNPDGYTDKDGVKHPSCFTRRHATLELPLAPDAALWAPRRDALLEAVREAVTTVPDKEFTRVHLFGNHRAASSD